MRRIRFSTRLKSVRDVPSPADTICKDSAQGRSCCGPRGEYNVHQTCFVAQHAQSYRNRSETIPCQVPLERSGTISDMMIETMLNEGYVSAYGFSASRTARLTSSFRRLRYQRWLEQQSTPSYFWPVHTWCIPTQIRHTRISNTACARRYRLIYRRVVCATQTTMNFTTGHRGRKSTHWKLASVSMYPVAIQLVFWS